ncbi:hypothetical protein [Sulfurimonas sp.]|uniref:hypothetical protein n=1 Tax=Sulfurimonas sp. TaxID=2022749 RepID=UPI0025F7B723|nr:hypothetical protein [Sulfurimonas sp.]MDD5156755.1 hypothetical protein [Sulfurimonas sp.]
MALSKILKLIYLAFVVAAAILLSACSSKEIYKPKLISGSWENHGKSDVVIKKIAQDAALIEDNRVLALDVEQKVHISKNDNLISYSDGWVISADIDGNTTLHNLADLNKTQKFSLKRTIASASVKDDTLAVLFSNNEMALYSISTKAMILKENGDAPIAVNSKIVKPYFKDDLVTFSTLDGKIVIINAKTKKKLRTIVVSGEEQFNNIIYFDIVDNKIIAATGYKILSLAEKEIRVAYDIRGAVSDKENIFITTKQGEVISLTPELKENAKIKFPFAHLLGIVNSGDKLYLLEKSGYVIEVAKNLLEYRVYKVSIDDGYIYLSGKVFYINNQYISAE